ncbi:hypothetical protein KIPE111705_43930 [Kibdelosporangium persicum]
MVDTAVWLRRNSGVESSGGGELRRAAWISGTTASHSAVPGDTRVTVASHVTERAPVALSRVITETRSTSDRSTRTYAASSCQWCHAGMARAVSGRVIQISPDFFVASAIRLIPTNRR